MEGKYHTYIQSIPKREIRKGHEGLEADSPVGGENVPELERGRGWLHNTGNCAKCHGIAYFKMVSFSVL